MDLPDSTGLETACTLVQETCGCEGVRRAARTVTQRYEQALTPTGIRATQFPILVGLGVAGTVPLTRLAEALAIDRTTLTRNLKGLQERGLVEVCEAEDGRLHLLKLTEEGRRALQESLERWHDVQSSVEERFGTQRLRHLLAELSALMDVIHS